MKSATAGKTAAVSLMKRAEQKKKEDAARYADRPEPRHFATRMAAAVIKRASSISLRPGSQATAVAE